MAAWGSWSSYQLCAKSMMSFHRKIKVKFSPWPPWVAVVTQVLFVLSLWSHHCPQTLFLAGHCHAFTMLQGTYYSVASSNPLCPSVSEGQLHRSKSHVWCHPDTPPIHLLSTRPSRATWRLNTERAHTCSIALSLQPLAFCLFLICLQAQASP